MSGDWRLLLDRALDGEELSAEERRALADALTGEEAAEWLGFDAALRAKLAPGGVAVSKERLLAKAALREKALGQHQAPSRRPVWLAVAAAAVVAVAVGAGWLLMRPRYPAPRASGAFELVRGGAVAGEAWALRRGDVLAARQGGARVSLGGYCEVGLDEGAVAVLRGEPGAEAVELRQGRAVAKVTPERGRFTLLTPLGSLEVKGTEFITTVESPDGGKGDAAMDGARRVVVTVMVVAGAVAFQFGGETGLLGVGMSQVFGAEEGEAPAVPEALRGFQGILHGPVLDKGDGSLVLRIDRIHKVWQGSQVKDPGKLETAIGKLVRLAPRAQVHARIREAFAAIKTGDRIEVGVFYTEDGRLAIVELLRKLETATPDKGEDTPKKEGPALLEGIQGFKGIFVGTIVEKGETAFVLKVDKIAQSWPNSKAGNPESVVGKNVRMTLKSGGRLRERLVPKLAALKAGDRVQAGASHLEANVFASIELLEKVE